MIQFMNCWLILDVTGNPDFSVLVSILFLLSNLSSHQNTSRVIGLQKFLVINLLFSHLSSLTDHGRVIEVKSGLNPDFQLQIICLLESTSTNIKYQHNILIKHSNHSLSLYLSTEPWATTNVFNNHHSYSKHYYMNME